MAAHVKTRTRRRRQQLHRSVKVATLVLVVLGVGLVAAYILDASAHRDRVGRNVHLVGHDISGLRRPPLEALAGRLGTALAAAEVRLDVTGQSERITTSAPAIKLHADDVATVDQAWRAARRGWPWERFGSWLVSWIAPRQAHVIVSADRDATEAMLAAGDHGREAAVEPELRGSLLGFTVTPGRPGHGISTDAVLAGLGPAAGRAVADGGHGLVRLAVTRGDIAPRFSTDEAQRLRSKAEGDLTRPLPVSTGSAFTVRLPVPLMRSWVRSRPGSSLQLAIDPAVAIPDLAKLLPDSGTAPVETVLAVVNGAVQVAPGRPGQACCADAAADLIAKAVFGGAFPSPPAPPLALPLKPVLPRVPAEQVAALSINQATATFGTPYQAGDPRVTNIKRMADLVRGWVILPGETFSLNTVAGPRTAERGFVPAQIVVSGHRFGTGLGGGVSQFATTLLNAAYGGGLDIVEHHSPELSDARYPFGRDATISYPEVDLKLKNPSPFGVLIWPTYSDTGLTVTLYSTSYATGAQTAQTVTKQGACQRVHTQRTRTYRDGHTSVDYLDAFYYPAEGRSC